MEHSFHVGTYDFHPESNINFQLNRQISLGGGRMEDIRAVSPKIKNLDDWKREFLALARLAEQEERWKHAASYYRGAEFFMTPGDPDKEWAYDQAAALFEKIVGADLDSGALVVEAAPYEKSRLPVFRLPAPERMQSKGTILLHGGYDSSKEELYPSADFVRKQGYDVYLFEGPGQGEALVKNGLNMTHEWEKPVGAVLDHYGLEGVALVGASLGGCLAPRAAAFEPRIKRVVAWGVMYDFFEVLTSVRGKAMEIGMKSLIALRAKKALNRMAALRMERDPFAKWGINHGMFVMGKPTPYDFLQYARNFSMKGVSGKVKQDFLLLAGTRDHFIPLDHYHRQARELTNVRSFTGRIFTEAEQAENHCQCGNIPLVFNVINEWMNGLDQRDGDFF
ncbi:Lysophospholipase, alpha-beta hydrolase superfamily [Desulfatibacillum alkenivorans DSM 16219]|uniref:Lysophospholipase, alpha-beta hydrolase superfamily n=1 Tax=Desulfatibacillum alkenivorans DSM 16219 TaxID=1121393 RepID=A0A1M6SU30_9BACT|nr:alpha/beta fold hydrolase [Desulfatibacillum alkenivorans]SHK48242.1 Lysophospholipase, alpha-beta hydrolase superfamily [Desulfatibacillum alkenivorans DSM 16219]